MWHRLAYRWRTVSFVVETILLDTRRRGIRWPRVLRALLVLAFWPFAVIAGLVCVAVMYGG